MSNSFKQKIQKNSLLIKSALLEEFKKSKFLLGSHNKVKLNKSLAAVKCDHLQDATLLTPSIHNTHSNNLAEKFINKLDSLVRAEKRPYKKNYTAQKNKFRFLTLLNSWIQV